jgi:hypothetical protein
MRRWVDLSGETIMRLLVEHSGLTISELYDVIGAPSHPGVMEVYYTFLDLAEAGLVTFDGAPAEIDLSRDLRSMGKFYNKRFRASDNWRKIRAVLSKKALGSARLGNAEPVVAHPVFGQLRTNFQASDVFVLMPFADDFKVLYTDHLKTVCAKLDITVMRADDLFTNNMVMDDIWNAIHGAGAVLAECTGRNPNVFYEIGIAHTVGVPVILLTRETNDVPADLRHMRYIKYDFTPRGCKTLEEELSKTLVSVLEMQDRY